MIPVLYNTITEGTVPADFGIGPLTDTLSATVKEKRNGEYELVLEYAAEGIHAEEIAPLSFIKAKPNFTDAAQLFEIYKVSKVMNGRFTVNARHVSYRLSNKLITTGTANSCTAACSLLNNQAGNFTINTNKTSTGKFTIYEPASIRSYFGGKAGSLLDIYGGEWKYNNFTASLMNARGTARGVTIRYGKNLTQLSQEINIENLATAILPFYKDNDGNVTTGAKINTGLTLDAPREKAVDFSQEVDPESATPIVNQLATLGARYISNNNFTVAFNSITLDFQQLEGLAERVDLCDTVKIYFEPLGITATAKCVATSWDVLQERYTACTFGDARTDIADTIATQAKELSQTVNRSFLAESVDRATALITGNLGGYVVLHDSDGDGQPDEILIMNTPDIETATKVWRWNKSGLGYSSTGYAGPYGLAMTANGAIVADFITTGVLNANLIKAGVIQDNQGNSSIDMETGAAIMKDFTAKNKFYLVDENNVRRAEIIHNISQGSSFNVLAQDGTYRGQYYYSPNVGGVLQLANTAGQYTAILRNGTDGGLIYLLNNSNKTYFRAYPISSGGALLLNFSDGTAAVYIYTTNYGGDINIKNSLGATVLNLFVGNSNQGELYIADGSGSNTIFLHGGSGNITCVSLTQTSSRKVKENIKPMADSKKILELEAVSFDYKDKARGVNRRGFIAEDVAEILPNLVTAETETTPATLDYVGMIPYLQQIIKEHESKIEELEKAVEDLKKART